MQIMEEQLRERKTQTRRELPQDIIHHEILTRLPHRSVIRFRCVCKPWLTLFSDPEFVKVHLTHHQCHDQNYLVKRFAKPELKIISSMKETCIDTAPFLGISLLIGSINGLICFIRRDGFTLWNPTMRQYKEFSTAQLHSSICKSDVGSCNWRRVDECRHLYGFGWDRRRNDYKMVIVCYEQPDTKHCCVYSANSDSWTQVGLPPAIFGTKPRCYIESPCPTIIVKECPYWSGSKFLPVPGKCLRRVTVVFKFVAENNEFRLLPDFEVRLAGKQELKLINLKDCLMGMAYKYNRCMFRSKLLDIYSLDHEGSAGVWSKMYTLEDTGSGFLSTRFLLERFTYTPSLVFVQGMKMIMHSET